MPRLNAATLPSLSAALDVPTYNRRAVRPGIVHLGVGGFHRSHQAMYLDRLMNTGRALGWGVCGIGVLPTDRRMKEVMDAQDCLYTLVEVHPDGYLGARVIGSLVGYLLAPDDPHAVVARMADPQTRIVSLTITEGGYNVSSATGEFLADEPAVLADLQPGSVPRSVFGLVVEALARRRAEGVPPFTVLSCDNLPGNGDVARRSFGAYAALRDPGLGDWVRREVAFPNSMVDRITPVTTDTHRAELARRFGVQDEWPVVCEPYAQWVLQDDFGCGRPPLEDAGVQLVPDVEPYELMKLRLLNGSHQALGQLGMLAGHTFLDEVCQDPLFRSFVLGYMTEEATPTLPPVPGIDLARYRADLIGRFANPQLRDTLARLCAESSDRIPKFLLPVIHDQLARGGDVVRSATVVAAWARRAEGVDENGRPIEVVDPRRAELMAAARRQREDPLAFLADRQVFGDLVDDVRFTAVYRVALQSLYHHGVRATLEAVTAGRLPGR